MPPAKKSDDKLLKAWIEIVQKRFTFSFIELTVYELPVEICSFCQKSCQAKNVKWFFVFFYSPIVGWVDVTWDAGGSNSYRMGAEGKFDLALGPSHDPDKLRFAKPEVVSTPTPSRNKNSMAGLTTTSEKVKV